jgi:uncharacterized phage protein (TIGR02220 family)
MNHSFNIDIAKKYGVECAIILENMIFWIEKNKANKKHFYEGRYWTYNSGKAFSELFPYWSVHQIGRFLRELEAQGLVISGNFNKAGYDKTKWYSVNDSLILQNCNIDYAKLHNPSCENAQPIPDINTDIKTNSIKGLQEDPIDFDALLVFFNKTTGRKFRGISTKAKKGFNNIIKQGYTKKDIRDAIVNCFNSEYHQENRQYLTPEFISRMEKFEKYFDSKPKKLKLPQGYFNMKLNDEQMKLLPEDELRRYKTNMIKLEMDGGFIKQAPIEYED